MSRVRVNGREVLGTIFSSTGLRVFRLEGIEYPEVPEQNNWRVSLLADASILEELARATEQLKYLGRGADVYVVQIEPDSVIDVLFDVRPSGEGWWSFAGIGWDRWRNTH